MNDKKNVLRDKSFTFAVRTVNLYKYIIANKAEYVLSKQLLRSGTSIGANVREAQNAESRADFIHKLGIAQKETDETLYWLELLTETDFLSEPEFVSMQNDATELMKIIRSIILTVKTNKNSVNNS
ncbi:MAG: four helix bundle protein [Bacteroidetes bacterium]|nr:four helix bundle protein [Bacteroidota bacterium]